MTPPVIRVVCSHTGHAERSSPMVIDTFKDYRMEPRLSPLHRDETGEVVHRNEPEWRAEIVRLPGPMLSDRGLTVRSGVTRLQPDGLPLWFMRCPPCRYNIEVSKATLGAVFDLLYLHPALTTESNGEHIVVELARLQDVVRRLRAC